MFRYVLDPGFCRGDGNDDFLRDLLNFTCGAVFAAAGASISPKDDTAMESLARYIIRMDEVCCKLPINDDYLYRDPEYSWDEYIQA